MCAVAVEKTSREIGAPVSENEPDGPPTKLSDKVRTDLERELADGVPVAVAAQRADVGRRTLTRWIAEGAVVRRRLVAATATRLPC
jgi:hypothetical protein